MIREHTIVHNRIIEMNVYLPCLTFLAVYLNSRKTTRAFVDLMDKHSD